MQAKAIATSLGEPIVSTSALGWVYPAKKQDAAYLASPYSLNFQMPESRLSSGQLTLKNSIALLSNVLSVCPGTY